MNSIQTYQGADGIKQAYRDCLLSKTLDIVCLSEEYEQVIGDFFDRTYGPALSDGTRRTREIIPDSPDNRAYAPKKGQMHETRYMKGHAEMDLVVSDSSVTIISFDSKNPGAVVISDKEIMKGVKIAFEKLWETCA